VTVPVLLAARLLGVPTLIHDSNAMPGLANRLLNRFATRTAVGLAAANSYLARSGVVTGTPARPEFFSIPPLDPRAATRRLLVFGGSQGAVVLNRALEDALPELTAKGVEVIHQTGEKHFSNAKEWPGVRRAPFLSRLYEELAWADLVVSRAGALTLAELAAAGRAAILVPFASATHGHQLENARAFAAAGAAVFIEEEDLAGRGGPSLAEAVLRLLADRTLLSRMGEAARTFARPDAARLLAELLFEAEATAVERP
jgi:UDP-N-acetylglucosamine--N-acetylmuramyl-(pentapeptide) pyrophosphoryl-undecaprenol N-acetylglucosamine transferase